MPEPDRRRRIAKACNICRRRRIKCDGTRPACARCAKLDTACVYADVDKSSAKKSRSHGPTGNSTTVLETCSDPDRIRPGSVSTSQTIAESNLPEDMTISRAVATAPPLDVTLLKSANKSNLAQACVLGGSQDARYFGPSTTFASMFHDTLGNSKDDGTNSFAQDIKLPLREMKYTTGVHRSLSSVFKRRVHKQLPSWEEALGLVTAFFSCDHRLTPLFDPPKFMELLGRQYTEDPPDDPAWWASLNAVLAISARRQKERQADSSDKESSAWEYASNAMDVVLEVMMRNISLQSVQALLGIAWFYFGTSNPQPSFMLSAVALRLAHAIGLHDPNCDLLSRPTEKESRRRIYWIAVVMDHQTSFRTGRPLSHPPIDYTVASPSACEGQQSDKATSANRAIATRLFDSGVQLSLIEMGIHQRLYSTSALASMVDRATVVQELGTRLQAWWAEQPSLHRDCSALEDEDREVHLGILRLHMRYHHCIILMNRVCGLSDYWAPRSQMFVASASSDIRFSVEVCVDAARAIARLINLIPEGEKSFFWTVTSFAVSAFFVLFVYVKREAHDPSPDLVTLRTLLQALALLVDQRDVSWLTGLVIICQKLCAVLQETLDNAQMDNENFQAPGGSVRLQEDLDPSTQIDMDTLPNMCDGYDSMGQDMTSFPWSFGDLFAEFTDPSICLDT